MSRYKAYTEYKDSGLQWLGKTPAHWDVMQSRRLFAQRKERARRTDEQLTASQKYGVIYQKRFMELEGQSVVQVQIGSDILKHVEPNDFVISMRSFQGGLEWCQYSGSVSSAYVGIIPVKHVIPEFFRYLFKSESYIQALQSTSNLVRDGQALRFENFSQVHLPRIPENEQITIAAFLDHETAKIDALIEKQQQLIELLKEKRQAVISHAVTKGLNPEAPMKDSGVEWLGEVPAHWVVGRYKFCTTRIVVGIAEAATHAYADTGIPILRSTNIREEGLDVSGMLFIKPEFANENESKYLYANDIITVRTGYPGISAVIPQDLDKSQCFTNLIGTPNRGMNPYFLAEYLNSHTGKSYFDLLGWGSAQKNISVPILQNIPISHPDTAEQARIVEFVKTQRDKYSKLIENAGKGIELLQERRTALISAAVTGKIDVRDWQAIAA